MNDLACAVIESRNKEVKNVQLFRTLDAALGYLLIDDYGDELEEGEEKETLRKLYLNVGYCDFGEYRTTLYMLK